MGEQKYDMVAETNEPEEEANPVVLVMGAASSGKTTVAKLLSSYMGLSYLEADNFHSEANVKKMKAGHPLHDKERIPWLKSISECLESRKKPIVLACSALKKKIS